MTTQPAAHAPDAEALANRRQERMTMSIYEIARMKSYSRIYARAARAASLYLYSPIDWAAMNAYADQMAARWMRLFGVTK